MKCSHLKPIYYMQVWETIQPRLDLICACGCKKSKYSHRRTVRSIAIGLRSWPCTLHRAEMLRFRLQISLVHFMSRCNLALVGSNGACMKLAKERFSPRSRWRVLCKLSSSTHPLDPPCLPNSNCKLWRADEVQRKSWEGGNYGNSVFNINNPWQNVSPRTCVQMLQRDHSTCLKHAPSKRTGQTKDWLLAHYESESAEKRATFSTYPRTNAHTYYCCQLKTTAHGKQLLMVSSDAGPSPITFKT